jgi:hypothetical protein
VVEKLFFDGGYNAGDFHLEHVAGGSTDIIYAPPLGSEAVLF